MSFSALLLFFSFFFLVLGFIILFIAKKEKNHSLIPKGKIVYDDLHDSSQSLYSMKYPLVGKPDLVLKKGWKRIPIEVKSGNHAEPRDHHVMQLMAYCQLCKEHYHKASPYGYLIYPDTGKRFKINYNGERKKRVKDTLKKMKLATRTAMVKRNHQNRMKCSGCKMKSFCEEKIQ
jgi:CRISPR-associated protein Cas4